jgi:uncharacterized protein (DUF1778 family)
MTDPGAKPECLSQRNKLGDRIRVVVSPAAFFEFQARLDAPPQPSERLRRTLATPAPWE